MQSPPDTDMFCFDRRTRDISQEVPVPKHVPNDYYFMIIIVFDYMTIYYMTMICHIKPCPVTRPGLFEVMHPG